MIDEPGIADLKIKRGEAFSFSFYITVNSVTLPLADSTVISKIRVDDDIDATLIDIFTVKVDGVATPNAAPTANIIELSLTAVETAALEESSGFYDVLVVTLGGDEEWYLKGNVSISDSRRVTDNP